MGPIQTKENIDYQIEIDHPKFQNAKIITKNQEERLLRISLFTQ